MQLQQTKPVEPTPELINHLKQQAKQVRLDIATMLTQAKSSHIGSCFSIVDILVTLYHCLLDTDKIKTNSQERDIFILSKGHAAAALYATLASVEIIEQDILKTYNKNGSKLCGYPIKFSLPGIEASSGSLGHGLSMGVGHAIAAKHDNKTCKIYVIVGDGECQEGSIWEALNMASYFKLNNLIVIVDRNNLQALCRPNNITTGNLENKFKAFCCNTIEINGHNFQELISSLNSYNNTQKPNVIIANTVKGKGVSFIENKVEWHYKSFNEQQFKQAKKELR